MHQISLEVAEYGGTCANFAYVKDIVFQLSVLVLKHRVPNSTTLAEMFGNMCGVDFAGQNCPPNRCSEQISRAAEIWAAEASEEEGSSERGARELEGAPEGSQEEYGSERGTRNWKERYANKDRTSTARPVEKPRFQTGGARSPLHKKFGKRSIRVVTRRKLVPTSSWQDATVLS